MRFRRRKAVPVAWRAAAGVLCLVHCLFIPHSGYRLTGNIYLSALCTAEGR